MNVRIRAHRILKNLENYKEITKDRIEIPKSIIKEIDFSNLVGLYQNKKYGYSLIIITEKGLIISRSGEDVLTTIDYSDILKIELPEEKSKAIKITISKIDGKIIELPITGGKGKFHDAFEFYRFLSRVLNDLKA